MKIILFSLGFGLLLISACKKDVELINLIDIKKPPAVTFTNYTIRQGKQYCEESVFYPVTYAELKFVVKFDSSAVYTTADPSNQADINKLYGFSDNNAHHQKFSARFGWRWSENALRIFAYTYNDSLRFSKELGTVQIGEENNYTIKVLAHHYIFSLNNSSDTLHRSSLTSPAIGYKLFPYFGGDELAPHDISIKIKEL